MQLLNNFGWRYWNPFTGFSFMEIIGEGINHVIHLGRFLRFDGGDRLT